MQTGNELWQIFLQFDYKEIRDLALPFLTLQTAILAFSATFSDKLLARKNEKKSHEEVYRLLQVSWGVQLLAILLVCLALQQNYTAGWRATHEHYVGSGSVHTLTSLLFFLGGYSFFIGLFLLVLPAFRWLLGLLAFAPIVVVLSTSSLSVWQKVTVIAVGALGGLGISGWGRTKTRWPKRKKPRTPVWLQPPNTM